jgi:phosphoglycerate-specific signal transduction histidine kinase
VQLQQVTTNLIVNAMEAMSDVSEGPRELTIVSGAGSSTDVFVEVQDTGPGLDPANLDRLFQSFYTTKPDAWAWVWRSAARLLRRMAGGYRPPRISPKARCFA